MKKNIRKIIKEIFIDRSSVLLLFHKSYRGDKFNKGCKLYHSKSLLFINNFYDINIIK